MKTILMSGFSAVITRRYGFALVVLVAALLAAVGGASWTR
jgi:hypothetical protein